MAGSIITETSTGRSLLLGEEDAQKEKRRIIIDDEEEPAYDPSTYRPKHRERATIKISDREMARLKKMYSQVIVHDFGDMYHLTDEEREKENDSYSLFKRIQQVKSKYRQLDTFVKAYRKVLDVVREIGKTNGVMEPEEFVNKVISGKIHIYGVRFPKLAMPKKKRRELNWDTITDYILNPDLDPKDLVSPTNPKQDWTTVPKNPQKEMKELFGMSYEKYVSDIHHDDSKIIDLDDSESVSGENVMVPMSRLEFLKLIKSNKEFGAQLKETAMKFRKFSEMERRLRGDEDSYGNTVFDVTYDDINMIRDMDEERNLLKRLKKPNFEFTGDFLNRKDVDRFLFEANQKLYEKTKVRIAGSSQTMTIAELEEELLREELEKDGYNIRALYGIGKEEDAVKKKVKKEAKRLKRIKKALTESENRKKKTKLVGFNVKKVKEHVNSDKKKKSKKQKKKDKKSKRDMEQMALLQSAFEDFEDYEEAMLNFDD